MARKRRAESRGRPPIPGPEIHLHVRLDEEADKALDVLAKAWECKRSEALREAIKREAKRTGTKRKKE